MKLERMNILQNTKEDKKKERRENMICLEEKKRKKYNVNKEGQKGR